VHATGTTTSTSSLEQGPDLALVDSTKNPHSRADRVLKQETMEKNTNRDHVTGQYDVDDDAMCTCGHKRGEHTCGKRGTGAFECVVEGPDGILGSAGCECMKFNRVSYR